MALSSLQGSLLLHSAPKTLKTLFPAATILATTISGSKTGKFGFRLSSDPSGSVRFTNSSRAYASSSASPSTGDSRPDMDDPEGIISGEWPDNFSLLSYDDLRAYLETKIISEKVKPSAVLGDVMSKPIRAVTAEQTLEEIDHHFELVSGLPVVDSELRCIGVLSKKDKAKSSQGLKSKVGEVMSSPAITLSPDKSVMDAAALMLKMKVHRIPIVNERQQVLGVVTRTDIFRALEAVEV